MATVDKNLGRITCPVCENAEHCYVRQAQSKKAAPAEGTSAKAGRQGAFAGALYVYCAEADGKPRCGALLARGAEAQSRIRSKAKWFGEAPAAGSVPRAAVPVARSENQTRGPSPSSSSGSTPPTKAAAPASAPPSPPPPAARSSFFGFGKRGRS